MPMFPLADSAITCCDCWPWWRHARSRQVRDFGMAAGLSRRTVLPGELLVALLDGASVGRAGGEVAQAAYLAAVVEGPGPLGEQCLEQMLEVLLLVVCQAKQCLLEHGAPGRGDLVRYCLPLSGQRDRGDAGVRAA